MHALFNAGILYVQELEDCQSGIDSLVALQARFPDFPKMDQVLFNLYYCYQKTGQNTRAAAVKKIMAEEYSHSNLATIVTTGKDPQGKSRRDEATRTYEGIYDLFIEGRFEEAIQQKKKADSIYGRNYWTPQLLYIEAVYYIKQQDDSTALKVLDNIIRQFDGQPLAEKATVMRDVLSRRAEIEEELRNLVIVMPEEDSTQLVRTEPKPVLPEPKPLLPDTLQQKPVDSTQIAKVDTKPAPRLEKPQTAFTDSSRIRSLRDTANQGLKPADAIEKPVVRSDADAYLYENTVPHYVVVVLNKVDAIFVNEARNAFFRYNRNTYFNKQMDAKLSDLDGENRLLLISPFATADEALNYVDKTRPITATEILPWLKGGKYSFLIISERNLQLLQSKKNLVDYQSFLDQQLPGRFP